MAVELPTFQELYDAGKTEAQTRQPSLTDFEPGSALDALAGAGAVLADDVLRVGLHAWRAAYVDTATGVDLDRRIEDFGGPTRLMASAATVVLTITRGAYVGSYTLPVDSEITGEAPDGSTVAFTTDGEAVLGVGAPSVTVQATCTATGRSGNVPPDTIDTYASLPAGLTIGHDDRAAGGSEGEPYTDEGDDAYRSRYKLFLRAQQPGTVAALEYGALLVSGVSFAVVDESTVDPESESYVGVYVGDDDGGSNDPMIAAVTLELENWRAAGIEVRVFGAEREELDFTITVTVREGSVLTDADIITAAIAWLDDLPPATRLYLSAFEAGIHALDEDQILSVEIVADATPAERMIEPSEAYYAIRTAADGLGLTVALEEEEEE